MNSPPTAERKAEAKDEADGAGESEQGVSPGQGMLLGRTGKHLLKVHNRGDKKSANRRDVYFVCTLNVRTTGGWMPSEVHALSGAGFLNTGPATQQQKRMAHKSHDVEQPRRALSEDFKRGGSTRSFPGRPSCSDQDVHRHHDRVRPVGVRKITRSKMLAG